MFFLFSLPALPPAARSSSSRRERRLRCPTGRRVVRAHGDCLMLGVEDLQAVDVGQAAAAAVGGGEPVEPPADRGKLRWGRAIPFK